MGPMVGYLCLTAAVAWADGKDDLAAARSHLQKGRYAEAIEAYEALAKDTKVDPAAVAIGLSRCYEVQGEWAKAGDAINSAIKKAPKSAPLKARLAEVLFHQGKFAETEKLVEEALRLDEDQPVARLVRADLYTETGRLTEADREYRWFVKYYNAKQPKDAETLLLVARGSAMYARWKRVSQIFNFVVNTLCPDALAADKNCWEAYLLSGELLLEKYNRGQAGPEFRQALTINPQAADVFVAQGQAALQEYEIKEAAENAARALAINPRHIGALVVKADLALHDANVAEALKFTEQALAVNPHSQPALARQAACFLLQDGAPPAKELAELLTHLDAIGEATIEKPGRFTQLVVDLAKRNPHPGEFLHLVGEALEGQRKFDLAERFYKASMTTMPQLSAPQTSLGMLYMRIGKGKEAQALLDTAFKADPFHVRVSNMRKVLKVLDEYETIATDHFVIRVSAADKLLGKYVAQYLEEQYPRLTEQFGFEPPQRTQFEIYGNSKGLSAHEWFSARMIGLPWIQTIGASTGMIVALASPTADPEQKFNWARVLKHEFVHILTLQQTQFNIPHWFTEALATMNEGYPRQALWNRLLVERVPKGDLMNLDNINLGFIRPRSPMEWQMAYCQSELYAQYMLERFGDDALRKLLGAYQRHRTTDQAILEVFKVKKEDFEKGYVEYLKKITAGLKAAAAEPDEKLSDLEKAHLADKEDPEKAARYSYGLLKAKQLREARRLAEEALQANPKEPLAAVVMAELALRGEDADEALTLLKAAFDEAKPHPRVLALLAKLTLQQGDAAEAARLFELGLKSDPDSTELLKGLASAALKLGQTEKLRPALARLADLDHDNPTVRKQLAQLAIDAHDYDAAIGAAKEAMYVDVMDPDVHAMLGEAYLAKKDFSHAVAELGVVVELKPEDAEASLALARGQAAAGKKTEARGTLEVLLKREPGNAEARAELERLGD